MVRAFPQLLPALALTLAFSVPWLSPPAHAQEEALPVHLRDRGPGIPTSMFGTYVRRGELLVYPFFESYLDHDAEYKPSELGYGSDRDFRGEFEANEALIFLGYGLSDRVAVELEASVIQASLDRAAADPTRAPEEFSESGIGNIEGQIRMRWNQERVWRPELFSYLEWVAPTERRKPLIGTPDWELKLGSGIVKGAAWGTVTLRAAAEYPLAESRLILGEYAVEYLKRVSPAWRLYLGVEGTQDEVSLITEAQLHLTPAIYLKLNNGFALTSKATDWAPEVGVMFSFPTARR